MEKSKEGKMNNLGVEVKEKIAMEDSLQKNQPKVQYCCPKMEFVATKLKQQTCPFCNKHLGKK